MRCDEADLLLDDLLDGALGDARELRGHLAACAACRETEVALRTVLREANALHAEIAPPRDLWPGVRERITRPARARWSLGWALPVAASLLVGLFAGALHLAPEAPASSSVPAVPAQAAVTAVAERGTASLDVAEREYARASARLLAALREQPGAVPEETLRALEHDLVTIDEALFRIRAAVRQSPQDPALTHMLASTQRRKLDALSRVMRLATSL